MKRFTFFNIFLFILLILSFSPTKALPICNMSVGIKVDSALLCGPQIGYGVAISNGTSPFTYNWSNGSSANTVCQQLSNGQSLCVTVTDVSGCQATACYTFYCNLNTFIEQDTTLGCGTQSGFTVYPSLAIGSLTYLWDNGSTSPSTCTNLGNNQTLCVSVTDITGCQATACYTASCNIYSNIGIIADSSNTCLGNDKLGFYNLGGGIAPYTFHWDNGSTTSTTCANIPIHQSLCVNITDANGCQATSCYTHVCGTNAQVFQDTTISCIGKSGFRVAADGGNPPYTYLWDNGGTGITTCENISVNQSICVTVTDANGCQFSTCYTASCPIWATINLDFDSTNSCVGKQKYSVSNLSGGLAPFSYHWDNGGIGPSVCEGLVSGQKLCVQITDANGCQGTSCYIAPPPCQAYFSHNLTNATTIQFYNQSVYSPNGAQWDFGDGSTTSVLDPTHTYVSPGIYNVCLTTYDNTGCSSQYCSNIVVQLPFVDVVAYNYSSTIVSGFPFSVQPTVYNNGNSIASGIIAYHYPAGTTFSTSSLPVSSHDVANRILYFNYTGLYPYSSFGPFLQMEASPTLTLGSVAEDSVWVTPLTGDINPNDNHIASTQIVVSSFDPNDKAVSPSGEGSEGIVAQNTSSLSYRIRFQNTGTAPARTVIVRDAIDNNIDINSIVVTEASHSHRFKVVGNEIEVTFDNINLADSFSNEKASHGYFMYNAKVKSGLPIETKIFNTARIYFDFNEPVVTNTVVTTLGKVSGIEEQKEHLLFNVIPNPTNNGFVVKGQLTGEINVSIIDALGIVIKQTRVSPNTMINVEHLASGIYIVKVESETKSGVQRIVIAH